MRLVKLSGQAHIVEMGGAQVLFSYEAAVALYHPEDDEGTITIVGKKHSVTTRKHINAFMRNVGASKKHTVPEDWFNDVKLVWEYQCGGGYTSVIDV